MATAPAVTGTASPTPTTSGERARQDLLEKLARDRAENAAREAATKRAELERYAATLPTAVPLGIPSPPLIDGVPAGAVGPLLVYARRLRVVARADASAVSDVMEVVTYDIGARRPIASFEIGSAQLTVGRLYLAGRTVVSHRPYFYTGIPHLVRVLSLDGTALREFQPPRLSGFAGRVLPSPDGRLFAQDTRDGVAIGDLKTGNVLHYVTHAPRREFEGLGPVRWSSNSEWVVMQSLSAHQADGLWLLFADGGLQELAGRGEWEVGVEARVATLLTKAGPKCGPRANINSACRFMSDGLIVHNLPSNAEVARLMFDEPTLTFVQTADIERILYYQQRPPADPDSDDWWATPKEWHVLDLRTGTSAPIRDIAALLSARMAAWPVVAGCPDSAFPLAAGQTIHAACSQLIANGMTIDSAPELQVLGIIVLE